MTVTSRERALAIKALRPGEDFAIVGSEIVWHANTSPPSDVDIDAKAAEVALQAQIDAFAAAVHAHVDSVARAKSYDSGISCATYVGSSVSQWATEAQAFVAWRDAVWTYAYQELAKVQAGTRSTPSVSDFVAELPAITWP